MQRVIQKDKMGNPIFVAPPPPKTLPDDLKKSEQKKLLQPHIHNMFSVFIMTLNSY